MTIERRLLNIGLIFAAIVVVGGIGYMLIEGWSWVDAFYMAVITITTVGFGEVHPLSPAGRLFTSVLVVLGVAAITYSFTAVTNYLIAGELGGVLEEFRMKRKISALDGHHIVCGYGRVGQEVCSHLVQEGRPLVVIDHDSQAIERARSMNYPVIEGDAGNDQTLTEAGILKAAGLVAALDSDSSNLFVVLTARTLKPDLNIVARADFEESAGKLLVAGASRVLSPYSLGGRLIAQTLIRPDVVDFLEAVMYDESLHLFLEDLTVGVGSSLADSTVGEARIREKTGANVLGLKHGHNVIISPDSNHALHPGDVLVALGTRQQLADLQELLAMPSDD
jgi:voltage-gated potassium channel